MYEIEMYLYRKHTLRYKLRYKLIKLIRKLF